MQKQLQWSIILRDLESYMGLNRIFYDLLVWAI